MTVHLCIVFFLGFYVLSSHHTTPQPRMPGAVTPAREVRSSDICTSITMQPTSSFSSSLSTCLGNGALFCCSLPPRPSLLPPHSWHSCTCHRPAASFSLLRMILDPPLSRLPACRPGWLPPTMKSCPISAPVTWREARITQWR